MTKFAPMSPEQFAALKDGDMVTHRSGKPYRVMQYNTGLHIRQVRNGKLCGESYPVNAAVLAMATESTAAPHGDKVVTAQEARDALYGADYAQRIAAGAAASYEQSKARR